jgi:hypothetical protein
MQLPNFPRRRLIGAAAIACAAALISAAALAAGAAPARGATTAVPAAAYSSKLAACPARMLPGAWPSADPVRTKA